MQILHLKFCRKCIFNVIHSIFLWFFNSCPVLQKPTARFVSEWQSYFHIKFPFFHCIPLAFEIFVITYPVAYEILKCLTFSVLHTLRLSLFVAAAHFAIRFSSKVVQLIVNALNVHGCCDYLRFFHSFAAFHMFT